MNHFWSGYRNPRLSKARDILLRASITRTPDARHNAAKIRLFASVVQIQRSPDPQQPSSSYFQQPTTNNDPIPNTYFETPNSAPLPPPPSPPPRGQRRYLRAALWAGLSFMLGYAWYEFLASPALLPNSYPAPGSLDDEAMRADIASLGSRAKAQRELESSDEWERQSNDEDIALFKTGFLASTGCVPYHALWLNRRKTGLVCFLHLGGALSSFPWTVHGGAISTVCSEICQKFVDIRTKTLASEVSPQLETVSVSYRRVARSKAFYAVTVGFDKSRCTDESSTVIACLTSQNGHPCALVTAVFSHEAGKSLAIDEPFQLQLKMPQEASSSHD